MYESAILPGFEQRVRERAYALWECEGRPFGRDAEHWRLSEEATLAEFQAAAPAKAPRKPARAKKAAPRRISAAAEMSAAL